MKLKLALGLLLSLWASPALAIPAPSNNWVLVGRSPQGDTALIDAGTVTRQGNQASYWVQINQVDGVISRSYAVANCNNRTKSLRWVVASQNGFITHNTAIANPTNINVQVASLGESAYQSVCFNHLDALVRARQTNAEMINRAMIEAAKLAR
jgi:hypothetical protein